MAPLQRSAAMNTAPRAASASLMVALSVPYTRRRVTPEQLKALNKLFDAKSHPSREDRVTLASEMGMELKTVTNWFQNKRQTWKKRSTAWSENSLPNIRRSQSARSVSTSPRRLHPTLSLDSIARLHERPSGPTVTTASQRPPCTPRHMNRQAPQFTDKNELWEHMPSSPIAPPSSPSAESVRLSAFPSRFKTKTSLEWACAKARADKLKGDDDLFNITEVDHRDGGCEEMETDYETDTEVEEAVTPDSSTHLSPGFEFSYEHKHNIVLPQGKENIDPNLFPEYHPSEDVEAAMVLLGFMGR